MSKENIPIPEILQQAWGALDRWGVWRKKTVKDKDGKDKITKVPYQGLTPAKKASSTKPETWSSLSDAQAAYAHVEDLDGIVFALKDAEYAVFDIDDCRDPATGSLHAWAKRLVERCKSYTEITPSGCGLRIIGVGSGPEIHRKQSVAGGVSCEVYRRAARFICVTGNQLAPELNQLADLDKIADAVVAQLDAAKQPKPKPPGPLPKGNVVSIPQLPSLDEIIKDGHFEIWENDRSKAEWHVLKKLIEAGKSDEEIVAIFTNSDNRIGEHCREHPEDTEKYLARSLKKARARFSSKLDDIPEADKAVILSLAALKKGEYEKRRNDAAKKLGYRKPFLDEIVERLRKQEGSDESNGQGRPIEFDEPDPWEHKVNGVELLNAITAKFLEHVVMAVITARAMAVWILFTYLVHHCFQFAPRVGITSATKGCGKSTLLGLIWAMAWRALQAANISPSATYRVIDKYEPTLTIDEADTYLIDNNELRGVLNSGHMKGESIIRASGEDFEPRAFRTFGAVAIAMIGSLPPTLLDRSIHVELQRRKRSDTIKPFRIDRLDECKKLARQCLRWAQDHKIEVAAQDPQLPGEVFNRAADNWRVLKAIADVVGGPWPGYIDEAALAACKAETGEDELVVMLLQDIQSIEFKYEIRDEITEELNYGGDGEIKSEDLVEHLTQMEGRPWAEMDGGKKLTTNKLARLLKPLAIPPDKIGPNHARVRGYRRSDFREAFERYFPFSPSGGSSDRPPVHNPIKPGTSDDFKVSTPKTEWTLQKCEKPNNDGLVDGWTVQKGEGAEKREKAEKPKPIPAPACPEMPGSLQREMAAPANDQGLEPYIIRELAKWFADRFEVQRKKPNGEDDPEAQGRVEIELRKRLLTEYRVYRDHVVTEFNRVMEVVFNA
jgi:putative DNA primase/helicase